MASLKTTIFGVILGFLLYAWYIAWFKPAEVSNLRSIVRQEFAHRNISIPARFQEPIVAPVSTTISSESSSGDISIEVPGISKFSFDPVEDPQRSTPSDANTNSGVPSVPSIITHLKSFIEKDTSPATKCLDLKTTYGVVPGTSWGALTPELQNEWNMLACDALIVSTPATATSEVPLASAATVPAAVVAASSDSTATSADTGNNNKKHKKSKKKGGGGGHKGEGAGLHSVDESTKVWCMETMDKYKVQPMKSWGSLPLNLQDSWKSRGCDIIFTNQRMAGRPISSCSSGSGALSDAASLPLIAIMAGSTTRKNKSPSVRTIPLFKFLLPSLIRSLDCGYRYEYVLGYDKGDAFYDSEEGMAEVRRWWKSNVEDPLSGNGIKISLRLVRVNNTLKKPGPVFNEMARSAYQGGADYFYRVNDDTELMVNWPHSFVTAVKSLSAPFGVVGPYCKAGNDQILTHDFVSRLHMEIFEMNYYPPELSDWWMDDWISFVYGKTRSFKAKKVPVVHHSGKKSYEVDFSHEALLPKLLVSGRKQIRQWMLKNGVSEEVIVAFDKDEASRFVHKDLPAAQQQ